VKEPSKVTKESLCLRKTVATPEGVIRWEAKYTRSTESELDRRGLFERFGHAAVGVLVLVYEVGKDYLLPKRIASDTPKGGIVRVGNGTPLRAVAQLGAATGRADLTVHPPRNDETRS